MLLLLGMNSWGGKLFGQILGVQAEPCHQHRRVFDALERMSFLWAEVQHLAGIQFDRLAIVIERHLPFDALDGASQLL
jgi:hypothetical protein